jgi:transglutaminase-like putative cysteine protease
MMRPDKQPLNRGLLISLIILITAAAAPHFFHLHIWITIFFLASVVLRVASIVQPRLIPSRLAMFVLALLGLGNVIIHHPILFSGETAVALMTSMVGLKLLEINSRRDLFIVVFVGFFLLATQFLFNQEIFMVVLVIILTTAFTGVLLENSRNKTSNRPVRSFSSAFILLLQALPVMLILFIFFPRLSGPLWFIDSDEVTGKTGLSDSITMGSISNLVLSQAVAFRVDFTNTVPAPSTRYWRGPVLWDTDGKSWSRGKPITHPPSKLLNNQPKITYSVTLEPTNNTWIMVLDLPTDIPGEAGMSSDYMVTRHNPITNRLRYNASSRLSYNTGPINHQEQNRSLQLPNNITQRMQQLVQSWSSDSTSKQDIVTRALSYFRNEDFYYTLRPPLLGNNPVDQFLFESRRGFCEHYASSFTLLMRIAGIPARIVTGYQGGEINPITGHLIVRQSDAHAWSEVWLQGEGWVRVDPTAAVAPERIERSFEFDASFASGPLGRPIDFSGMKLNFTAKMIKQLRWGMDAINASWHRWVLGYTRERQSTLMNMLGLDFLRGHSLALAMVGFASVVVLLLGLSLWRTGNRLSDRVLADYLKFCNKLAKKGMTRSPTEGAHDFLQRICHQRPDIAPAATKITLLYLELRYGQRNKKERSKSLNRMIKQFKP